MIQDICFKEYKPWQPFQWSKQVTSSDAPEPNEKAKRRRTQSNTNIQSPLGIHNHSAQIPTYASILNQQRQHVDGTATLVTQTSEITSLQNNSTLEGKLQQTCEMMQTRMQRQESRMEQL